MGGAKVVDGGIAKRYSGNGVLLSSWRAAQLMLPRLVWGPRKCRENLRGTHKRGIGYPNRQTGDNDSQELPSTLIRRTGLQDVLAGHPTWPYR